MKNGEKPAKPISRIENCKFFPRRLSAKPAQVRPTPSIKSLRKPTESQNRNSIQSASDFSQNQPERQNENCCTVGVELDKKGNLYVAYKQDSPMYEANNLGDQFHAACRDVRVTASGVYKIELATKKVTALATKADGWPFCFPDDIDIDDKGNVYLTDLTYAGIWKISPDAKKVDL